MATKAWRSKVFCQSFFLRADGENQREDSEDTEMIDKASGSRKQGVASRSFKTSWLKLFPWCNYNPLRDTAYCTDHDCREVGYSSEWAASKLRTSTFRLEGERPFVCNWLFCGLFYIVYCSLNTIFFSILFIAQCACDMAQHAL